MKTRIRALVPLITRLSCLTSAFLAIQSQAQIIHLQDGNAAADINTGSQAGMFDWFLDGQNYLNQQWFWYRIGPTGGESSINAISAPHNDIIGPNEVITSYTNANNLYHVSVDYLLTGGTPGSGIAHVNETVKFVNTSGGSLDLHFFQYSDFNLSRTSPLGSADTIALGKDNFGRFNEADQSAGGGAQFQEAGVTPGADHGEPNFNPNTLNSLNDANPTLLNDQTGPLGPGDMTYAFEWDRSLGNGSTLLISKLKNLTVPEPSTSALILCGIIAAAARRRRSV